MNILGVSGRGGETEKAGRKRYTVGKIIGELREAEIAIEKGLAVRQAARRIGVTAFRRDRDRRTLRLPVDQAQRWFVAAGQPMTAF